MKTYSPIIRSIVTEKSSLEQSKGKYAFLVRKDTNKIEIKKAIKELYGADVAKVQMMLSPKKERVLGRGNVMVKRPVFKKAIVTLKGKKTIDPNKFKDSKKSK